MAPWLLPGLRNEFLSDQEFPGPCPPRDNNNAIKCEFVEVAGSPGARTEDARGPVPVLFPQNRTGRHCFLQFQGLKSPAAHSPIQNSTAVMANL